MNILLYSYDGFNPEQGGIERVSNNLAKGFMNAGHRVFYVALYAENYIPLVEQLILNDKTNICSSHNINQFSCFVEKNKIDIIICQQCYDDSFTQLAFLVKKACNIKLLFAFHTSPDYMALLIDETSSPVLPSYRTVSKQYRRILRIVFKKQKQASRNKKVGKQLRRLYEMGDGVVLLSKKYIPLAAEFAEIDDVSKFYGIGNPNTYTENEIVSSTKENTVLFVGRLSIEKRPEKVLILWSKIQNRFPDWNLKIVGTGNLENDLKYLSKKFKLKRCYFEGQQTPKNYYENAKILLVTSDVEGFGMTITEAMQHRVIPVAFNSYKALTDIIENNVTGIAVKPYDLEEFETKLTALMMNEKRISEMAELCPDAVKKFDTNKIVNEWEKIFRELGFNN